MLLVFNGWVNYILSANVYIVHVWMYMYEPGIALDLG